MNNFETQVLNSEGTPQEKLKRWYGKELNYTNARKYFAGIKLHIAKMQTLEPDKQEFLQHEVNYSADQSQTIKQDVYLSPDEAASPVKIMAKMGFDPMLWQVVSCKVISGSWDVTIKNKACEGILHTNRKYNVTLTVKPLAGTLSMPQVIEAFKDLEPVHIDTSHIHWALRNPYMLELPMMDFHLGKLSWGDETGQDNYDLKIAEALWKETINDILGKVYTIGQPEHILFPIGQDFFHFDTPGVATTGGTQLDSDVRWQKMFRKGVDLLVWAIEQCYAVAPVKVLWIPGNHDQMLSYAATVGLAQRYANTEGVDVDLSPTPRKYYLYGLNLIGFAHGVEENKRIEGLMQIEAPVAWGASVWREYHLGHLHTEITSTKNGIVFRRISSITAADSWHSEHGFLGTVRQAQAFVWDKERGLQMVINSNVISPTHTEVLV